MALQQHRNGFPPEMSREKPQSRQSTSNCHVSQASTSPPYNATTHSDDILLEYPTSLPSSSSPSAYPTRLPSSRALVVPYDHTHREHTGSPPYDTDREVFAYYHTNASPSNGPLQGPPPSSPYASTHHHCTSFHEHASTIPHMQYSQTSYTPTSTSQEMTPMQQFLKPSPFPYHQHTSYIPPTTSTPYIEAVSNSRSASRSTQASHGSHSGDDQLRLCELEQGTMEHPRNNANDFSGM